MPTRRIKVLPTAFANTDTGTKMSEEAQGDGVCRSMCTKNKYHRAGVERIAHAQHSAPPRQYNASRVPPSNRAGTLSSLRRFSCLAPNYTRVINFIPWIFILFRCCFKEV